MRAPQTTLCLQRFCRLPEPFVVGNYVEGAIKLILIKMDAYER